VEGPFLVSVRARLGAFGDVGNPRVRLGTEELAKPGTTTRLTKDLRQDTAFLVDLPARDNNLTVRQLESAFEDNGVKVVVAGKAQQALKAQRGHTSYILYAENLRPDELARILTQLGGNARPGVKENGGPAAVEEVVVSGMTPDHRQQLATLLGVPAERLRPAAKGPSDPPEELLNKKIIAGGAKGQGSNQAVPAGPRAPDRLAVVLAMPDNAVMNPVEAPEVEQFLRERGPQRPGTLQVVLVVHEASA
jgi:hypothetical protein